MTKEQIITLCKALLIILWMYAAATKLLDHQAFIFSLSRQPLPSWVVPILAIALPAIELAIALLLAIERFRGLGFLISFLLMTTFTIYVGLALSGVFGAIPCSCGGIISKLRWKGHLVFNITYTVIAWIGLILNKKTKRNNLSAVLNNSLT